MNYITLPLGSRAPEVNNAVVEIPRGETNKYEYEGRKKSQSNKKLKASIKRRALSFR